MTDPKKIQEEKLRARRLRMMVDLIRAHILQGTVGLNEALMLCRGLRKAALELFPDKGDTFDLIYKPRLQRDMRERFGSAPELN